LQDVPSSSPPDFHCFSSSRSSPK